jgi:hypothetical protein
VKPPQQTYGYRSSRISNPAAGTVILPPSPNQVPSYPRRVLCAALDILALPFVLAGPRRTINIAGVDIPLVYEFRRWAWRSERAIELGLGLAALEAHSSENVLEVGNVMPLAGRAGHTVVDKYERAPGVINEDILDFSPGRHYALALSLSTVEHIGWDEVPQEPEKAWAAVNTISDLVERQGSLLITIPIGCHTQLEANFVGDATPFDNVLLLVKRSRLARWEKRPLGERRNVRYGAPYANGNGILIGLRGRPFGPTTHLERLSL